MQSVEIEECRVEVEKCRVEVKKEERSYLDQPATTIIRVNGH